MKKYFMIAMTAVVLMACGSKSESTGLPEAEDKALEVATVEAIDQLGESPETVDAALVKAGFKQAEIALPDFGKIPARSLKKAPAGLDGRGVTYVYGLPDNYKSMSDAQVMAWMVQRIVDGKPIIIAIVTYENNKMANMGTSVILAKNDKSSKVYTATSENLYSKLPSDKSKSRWEGGITYGEGTKDTKTTPYDDHSAYVAAVAKAEGMEAYEQATALTEGSLKYDLPTETAVGYMYYCNFINPSAQQEAEQLKSGAPAALVMQSYSITIIGEL